VLLGSTVLVVEDVEDLQRRFGVRARRASFPRLM